MSDQLPESRMVFKGQDASRSERPVLPLIAMATSGSELQLPARSGSMVLLQLGSVLMSEAPVTIERHADT